MCIRRLGRLPSRSRTGLLDHRAWLDRWLSMRGDDDQQQQQQQQQQLGCWWWSLPDKRFEIAAATSAKRRRIWHPTAREITPPPPPPTTSTTTEHAKIVSVVWFLVDHHFACFCLCTFVNSEDEEFDSMILEDSVSSLVSCYVCLDYLLLVGTRWARPVLAWAHPSGRRSWRRSFQDPSVGWEKGEED